MRETERALPASSLQLIFCISVGMGVGFGLTTGATRRYNRCSAAVRILKGLRGTGSQPYRYALSELLRASIKHTRYMQHVIKSNRGQHRGGLPRGRGRRRETTAETRGFQGKGLTSRPFSVQHRGELPRGRGRRRETTAETRGFQGKGLGSESARGRTLYWFNICYLHRLCGRVIPRSSSSSTTISSGGCGRIGHCAGRTD